MVWYGLLAQPRNRKRAAQKLIVCRHNQVKVDLDKKEAIKALQRNTSKEEPKMLEWIPNKEHLLSPFVILMIRSACKSRELPYDSQDVTLVNEDGAQGCSCSAESSKKNTHPIILGNTCGPNIYGKDMVNIRPRYPKYRSKISVRYEGSWG